MGLALLLGLVLIRQLGQGPGGWGLGRRHYSRIEFVPIAEGLAWWTWAVRADRHDVLMVIIPDREASGPFNLLGLAASARNGARDASRVASVSRCAILLSTDGFRKGLFPDLVSGYRTR